MTSYHICILNIYDVIPWKELETQRTFRRQILITRFKNIITTSDQSKIEYSSLKMMYDAVKYQKVCEENNSQSNEKKEILNQELMRIILQYVGNVSACKATSLLFMPPNYITSIKVNNNADTLAIDTYLNKNGSIRIVEFVECEFLRSANVGGLIYHHCQIDRFIINRCQNVHDRGFFSYTDAIGTTFASVNGVGRSVSVEFKGNWRIFPYPTPSMTPVDIIDIAKASFGTGNYFGHLGAFIDGSLFRFNDYRPMFVSMFQDDMFKILNIDYSVSNTASVSIKSRYYGTLICVLKMRNDLWLLNTVYEKSISVV